MTRRRVATLLLLLSVAAPAAEVRRAEDTTVNGRLVAVRDGKLLVQPAGASAVTAVSLDDMVEVTLADTPAATTKPTTQAATQATTRPATTRAAVAATTRPTSPSTRPVTAAAPRLGNRPWTLKLATPDTLTLSVTAWAGGRLSGTLGESTAVAVPVASVAELWCGPPDQVAAAQALGETAATDDVAYALRDAKVIAVHGVAEGVENGALRFKFADQTRTIALARLVGVAFAKPAAADPAAAAPQQAVLLSTGDSLPGTWTGIDDSSLTLIAAWGQPLTVARRDAKQIAFRNGRVVSLSDLKPSDVQQTPYFDRLLPWRVDVALDGQPLQLSDGPAKRGLAVHARTVLTFPLDGAFVQFRSHVGFQLPGGRLGNALVRVVGDGRTLFEKPDARGVEPPFDVNVNVEGVRRLSLEVDFGQGQDVGDRVVWGNARVLRPQVPAAARTTP